MFFNKINQLAKLTDQELLDRYKNSQDKIYLGEIFDRYSPLVLGVSMKYLKDKEKSKDLTMHVFEKLVTELVKRNITDFKPWLYQVTKNECFMVLRKEKSSQEKEIQFQKDEDSLMEFEDFTHLTDDKINRERLLIQLEECINNLNTEQQQSIQLFYIEEKSYQEVSDALKFELKKVKSYIQNGKRNLKMCLEKTI